MAGRDFSSVALRTATVRLCNVAISLRDLLLRSIARAKDICPFDRESSVLKIRYASSVNAITIIVSAEETQPATVPGVTVVEKN